MLDLCEIERKQKEIKFNKKNRFIYGTDDDTNIKSYWEKKNIYLYLLNNIKYIG